MTTYTTKSHTPGPWIAPNAGVWTADGKMMIAELGSRKVTASRRKNLKAAGLAQVEHSLLTNDCRLIASAPDMLSALREVYAYIDAHAHGRSYPLNSLELAVMVRETIAKATGSQL
jgi:hypothetical protein